MLKFIRAAFCLTAALLGAPVWAQGSGRAEVKTDQVTATLMAWAPQGVQVTPALAPAGA